MSTHLDVSHNSEGKLKSLRTLSSLQLIIHDPSGALKIKIIQLYLLLAGRCSCNIKNEVSPKIYSLKMCSQLFKLFGIT